MAKNGSARSRQTENHPDAHTLIRAILTILRDSTSGNLYVYLISKKWIHCSNHKCQSERVREKNIACFRSANIGLTASQRKRMSVCMQAQELITEDPDMKIPEKMIALSILVALGILPQAAGAQTRDFAATTTAETSTVASRQTYPNYVRPTPLDHIRLWAQPPQLESTSGQILRPSGSKVRRLMESASDPTSALPL